MIDNHASVEPAFAATSPHHDYYYAELLTPKYEDANGHAAGIKAPGGFVVRTDTNGSFLEMFVGGCLNDYYHAFNRGCQLFKFQHDLERGRGLRWYRPTPGEQFCCR